MPRPTAAVAATAPANPIARLWDWAVARQLRAVDAEYIDPARTSDSRILWVVYSSCMALYLLNYVVLDWDVQHGVSSWLIERFDLFSDMGKGGKGIRLRLALTMRVTWSLGCMIFYLGVPLLVVPLVLRRKLSTLGLSPRGFFRHLWVYALLFLPVGVCVWIVSYQQAFQSTYPFYRNPATLAHLLVWELFYGLQFFSLEVFFRGFMLTELKHRWGWRAMLFMMTPYCMIHFSKPALEALGAVIAGSVLGVLALRTRSIWGGVAIHVSVAWWMDIASLLQRGWFSKG